MAPVWGLTEKRDKRAGRDPAVLPGTVIYDPELIVGLPPRTSAASGMNALAHAVEALYAPDVCPVVALMAEEAARCLATALPAVVDAPHEVPGRALALRSAWLAGACLGATRMSLHHKLCHVLGGLYDLPHAETHAVVLPHVAAFNLVAAPCARARAALRRAFGGEDLARALGELLQALGLPTSLAALGLDRTDPPAAADTVLARPYVNPRPADHEAVLGILDDAWGGALPHNAVALTAATAAATSAAVPAAESG